MRIDVHAHYWPTEYFDLLERFGRAATDAQPGLGAGGEESDLAAKFAMMHAAGVQLEILSVPAQPPYFEAVDQATARRCHLGRSARRC